MKLFAYVALVAGVSAIKLSQKHSLHPQKLIKLAHKLKQPEGGPRGPPEGANELEAWAAAELADGGTITKEEAYNKAVELGVPESMMDELEAGFDAVDADGNGELDQAEVEAAMDHMGVDEDVQWPTEQEIKDWVMGHIEADGDLTKEEAATDIAAWADENGVTIPQEMWDMLEAAFDAVDANGDGALTIDELAAAFEHAAEEDGAPADRPPRGSGGRGPRGGALLKMKNKLRSKLSHKSKAKQPEGPPQGANELEAWAAAELADGGTITKEEAYNKAVELGVPESMMDELEAGFDAVDADGNGELDQAEVEAAMEHMGIDEDVQWPTEQEMKDWVMGHIEADGDLTKEEAATDIAAWADENGVTIPQEAWDMLEAGFDAIDANGDGALTIDELAAAFEHVAEEEGAPADRPPRGSGGRGPRGGALLKTHNKLKNKLRKH